MSRITRILLLSFLLLNIFSPAAAQQDTGTAGVVHAVLLWMEGCQACEEVMKTVLPEVQAQFGVQLDVELVEVSSTEDVERLYRIGAALGLEKEQTGVPMIVIADRALVGSEEIPAQFKVLVAEYIQAGGAAAPDLEQLAAGAVSVALETEPVNDGMVVAWVVLVGMAAAVVFAGVVLGLALNGRTLLKPPARLDLLLPVLGLIGMGVALYMLYVEATHAQAICGPLGDCNAVQNSPYAKILGILPVGLAGVGGYLAILGAWAWGRRSQEGLASAMPVVLFGLSAFGTLYSIYLTYLEIFVIHAVCMWCISSAVVMTLILLVSLPKAAAWLVVSEEEQS